MTGGRPDASAARGAARGASAPCPPRHAANQSKELKLLGTLVALVLLLGSPARGQLLAGPWVDRAEARIAAHRMADLEVRVLGPGDRPVAGAEVSVTQLRHAFPFGVELPLDAPGLIERVGDPDRALWRGLSAVSLAHFAAWPRLEPDGPALDPAAAAELDALLDAARARGLRVRLGAVAPGDAADRPGWAVEPPEAEAAAKGFQERLLGLVAGRGHALDAASAVADRPWLSTPALRRLGQAARVRSGDGVWLGLGVRDALGLDRGGEVLDAAEGLARAFVPVNGVTSPWRLRDAAEPADLERALQRLETFELDAAIAPLEVGGDPADRPFTLEAALLLAFAEPRVREIQLGGVEPGRADALFDAAGNPTEAGAVVDRLIADRWWTAATGTTDALGVARFRVFAGLHEVAAVLPGGEAGAVEARVVAADEPTLVVLGVAP